MRHRAALVALAIVTSTRGALAKEASAEADAIGRRAHATYEERKYAFCTDPVRPLRQRQQNLCELAPEVENCAGFAKACDKIEAPTRGWLERLAEILAPFAQVLLYVLVIGVVILVAIPVIRVLMNLRRTRRARPQAPDTPNVARVLEVAPVPVETLSDAELALRLAEEHRARGQLKESLGLYLAASLVALDRRGAIRLARHRTNGEYVRACADETARSPLREIVREVDRAEFGGTSPTSDRLESVARQASTIVRGVATVALLALFCLGCSPQRPGADPAGDELPLDVLKQNGFEVRYLTTSVASMPIPSEPAKAPVVVIDLEKVPLEPEARAHLARWVEAGGALVILGHVGDWPTEVAGKTVAASTRDLTVPVARSDDRDGAVVITRARTARRDAFEWDRAVMAEPVALLGDKTYASKRTFGKGIVLGVANDDLLTNIGMMPMHNPAALVAIVRSAASDPSRWSDSETTSRVEVARAEDGVPPPSNPFAALVAAGLGRGAWHALVATLLLFLAYGTRHARARSPSPKPRRAFAEHVEATAALYARAQAHPHALSAYGRFVEARVREGIPGGADPVAFLAARSDTSTERVAELYERATKAKDDDEPKGDELTTIEELRRIVVRALGVRR